MLRTSLIITAFFVSFQLSAKNYYCNPVTGNISNNGSINNPWSTMKAVFDANIVFEPSDTLFLYSGSHGEVEMTGSNNNYVVIKAIEGETPILQSLHITNPYWKFEGLHVSSFNPKGKDNYDKIYLVRSTNRAHHLFFESCSIYSTDKDVSGWNRDDWFFKTKSGMHLDSKYNYVYNCSVKNINFGIAINGDHSEVMNNTVENIMGDGLRGTSSYSKFEYNTVKNFYDITGVLLNVNGENPSFHPGVGNHDDMFQSFSSPNQIHRDVIIRYNVFIAHDHTHFDMSETQGIGCFDGRFANWTIENNLIVTDHWHGITFLGIDSSIIANNTIIYNPIGGIINNLTPWIWIGKEKEKYGAGPSIDNTIRNNLVIEAVTVNEKLMTTSIIDDGTNTKVENNIIIPLSSIDDYFVDFKGFDLKLKSNSPAIDKGINTNLTKTDLAKNKRVVGANVDCGAYEFQNASSIEN